MPNRPNVKILVATHKPYRMPADPMYCPICVGAEGKHGAEDFAAALGYAKDNEGDDQISELNPYFCELTALYWGWKNLDAAYIGLVHYRRHFSARRKGDLWERVLTYHDIEAYIGSIKIFVPKKRRYIIETLYSHYAHTHYADQLDQARIVIEQRHPEYLESFDATMKRRSGFMFNMMILRKDLFDRYCEWLFEILFELRKRLGKADFSAFQRRFYGRVGEIIFNVWLNYQIKSGSVQKKEIKELPFVYMEKIDRRAKVIAFLQAKFLGKKYEASF